MTQILEIISFFRDIHKNDDEAIIEKFEPVNVRDDFEYAFKMFSRTMDQVMPEVFYCVIMVLHLSVKS